MNNLVFIGNIIGTHSLAGTIKLHSSFYLLEDILNLTVILKNDVDMRVYKIKSIKGNNGKRALVDLEGLTSIEEAKKLVGYKMYIRKDLIPEYEEEENLIDYEVYNKGEFVGKVVDIMETAAHDILVVEGEKEILIPYIDVFVNNIDDDNRKIDVELLEGMI